MRFVHEESTAELEQVLQVMQRRPGVARMQRL
jgi:hypothetical protein